MCLILFALDCHPEYKLVLASNRDEFYQRPSLPLHRWEDEPSILAGRDLSHNGTWMGITPAGRFSALTNFRDPVRFDAAAPSRGGLVAGYLRCGLTAREYIKDLAQNGKTYNGYNLLAGGRDELYYYSNRAKEGIVPVEKGIHGLSNGLLDAPWPKVRRGKQMLEGCLQSRRIRVESLFELLADGTQAPDGELPETGVPLETERMLSPIFIKSPGYGTCASSVVLIDRRDRVVFHERSFRWGKPDGEARFEFQIDAAPGR